MLGHGPPPRGSRLSNGWDDLNQDGCYLLMQIYQSPDLVVQHALDQERYAAQLASHYQSVAERNAKAAEEKAVHAEQEIDWLRQTIQQQSTLQNPSPFTATTQASTPNEDAMLAGQLAAQTAASAAPPVLSQSATTIPAVGLPAGTYSIYCLLPDPATVTQYVDPWV